MADTRTIEDGMKLAQLYKYFAQWSNPSIER